MRSIAGLFPDAHFLITFRPEDLGPILIEYFKRLPSQTEWMAARCAAHWSHGYPPEHQPRVQQLLLDTWRYLVTDGRITAIDGQALVRHRAAGDGVSTHAA